MSRRIDELIAEHRQLLHDSLNVLAEAEARRRNRRGSVVCVAVPPDDGAADHAGLFAMAGVVGGVVSSTTDGDVVIESGLCPASPAPLAQHTDGGAVGLVLPDHVGAWAR